MKKKTSFTAALWWILALAIAGIFLMITSPKESRESEAENRMLQGFPTLSLQGVFSADYMNDFENFLTDAFFSRDEVISFTNRLIGTFSVLSKDDELAAKTAEMEKELQGANIQAEDEKTSDIIPGVIDMGVTEQEKPEQESDESEIQIAASGEIPLTENTSYLWYERTDGTITINYTYELSKIKTYSKTLRRMQEYLPDDGLIFFTQVPLANMASRWSTQQDSYSGWGSSVETMLESCLEDTERIHVISTYDILEPYICGDTPMFYTTDHHWTAEGAYKVAAEMIKITGMPVIPYEEYSYKSIVSAAEENGYHDTFNALYPLLPVHSYIMTDRDEAEEINLMNYNSTTYRVYMNDTRLPWRKVTTGANTGRKCLIICDSFGNAFAPWMLPYYDEVHMADFRKGSYSVSKSGGYIGQMIRYHEIDDVYIITSTANGLRKDNSIEYLRIYLEK